MTPEQMRLRAVEALAGELDRRHDDPRADAERFIGRLLRSGWRPQPSLADLPVPARRAPAPVQREAMATIRATLVERRDRQGGAA